MFEEPYCISSEELVFGKRVSIGNEFIISYIIFGTLSGTKHLIYGSVFDKGEKLYERDGGD